MEGLLPLGIQVAPEEIFLPLPNIFPEPIFFKHLLLLDVPAFLESGVQDTPQTVQG